MRLLVVTGLWPTDDAPTAGTFVRERLENTNAVVIAARSYRRGPLFRYARMLLCALTVRGQFDGVEAHVLFPAGMIGLLASRIRRIPLVVVVHGSDISYTARRGRLIRYLSKVVARSANQLIANSRATQRQLLDLGADAQIISPGVDLTLFRPSPRTQPGRVLYLGGAAAHKGVRVARRCADTLAGPGLRVIPPDEVPTLMADHDIVLVPSEREGFGLVAAQAIASGRWVVASGAGGLPEVVLDGVNGTLVTGGDFQSAITSVPNYDPTAVAATAGRFDIRLTRDAFSDLWKSLTSS